MTPEIENRMTPEIVSFDRWLKASRPEVLLTLQQKAFIGYLEVGVVCSWAGGRASGHTTAINLWRDYLHDVTLNPVLGSPKSGTPCVPKADD